MAKPGCRYTCGTVIIPYLFGIGSGCALNPAYTISCKDAFGDSKKGPKPYLTLPQQELEVLNVCLSDQTVTIEYGSSHTCWDQGSQVSTSMSNTSQFGTVIINSVQAGYAISIDLLSGSPFLYSREQNRLMFVGCGNALLVSGFDSPQILSGCTSMCISQNITGCYGINCCQASVPYYLSWYTMNLTASPGQSGCAYALLVDQRWTGGNYLNPSEGGHQPPVPVVLSWTFQNYSDIDAISGCSPKNRSLQLESMNISNYQCEWRALRDDTWFYQINPYLDGACQKAISQIRASRSSRGAIIIGATIGAGMLIFMIIISISYNALKKRWKNRRKEKFFKRMLQKAKGSRKWERPITVGLPRMEEGASLCARRQFDLERRRIASNSKLNPVI